MIGDYGYKVIRLETYFIDLITLILLKFIDFSKWIFSLIYFSDLLLVMSINKHTIVISIKLIIINDAYDDNF